MKLPRCKGRGKNNVLLVYQVPITTDTRPTNLQQQQPLAADSTVDSKLPTLLSSLPDPGLNKIITRKNKGLMCVSNSLIPKHFS